MLLPEHKYVTQDGEGMAETSLKVHQKHTFNASKVLDNTEGGKQLLFQDERYPLIEACIAVHKKLAERFECFLIYFKVSI